MRVLQWLSRAPNRFIGSRRLFHVVFAILLFVPHCFGSRDSPEPYKLGIPRIHSGDEPHYLVFVHSIVDDGDLDLANNYANVHKGSEDAGYLFRGAPLNHHSIWFLGDHRVHWFDVFENEEVKWDRDEAGHPSPRVRKDLDPKWLPPVERPWNSAGLPLVLSPLFYALKMVGLGAWTEPFATVLSGIAILIASFFWRILVSAFTSDRRIVNLSMALAFLGTPAWHYGRSFFSEPYLICLVIGAYAFAMVRQRYYLAGFLVGVALIIKPIAVLMGVPIGVLLLLRGQLGDAIRFSVPVAIWVGVLLVENALLYGGPLHMSNAFLPGFLVANGLQLIAHPTRGMLSTAPIVLVAAAGWGAVAKHSRGMLAALAACILFFLVNAYNFAWSGGYAYSDRFLVPLMPLFCLGLVPLLKSRFRNGILVLGALSMFINFLAAVQYWRAFHDHPLLYMIFSTDRLPH